jgi:hypothetical protein
MPFSSLADLLRRPVHRLVVPSSVALPDSAAFLERQPSLSLIVFRGAVEGALHDWLGRNGWRLIASAPLRAGFEEISERSTHMRKTEEKVWEVVKATYVVAGCTVLIDREMVVGTRRVELAELCRVTGCPSAVSGIWERVSRTLDITEVTAAGAIRSAAWTAGVRQADVDPWPHVTGSGPGEIVEAFRLAGIPVDAIFGHDLAATMLLLAE